MDVWDEQEVLPSDVVQLGPRSLRDITKAKAALQLLAQYGWIVPLPEGAPVRGKARRIAYRVVRTVK